MDLPKDEIAEELASLHEIQRAWRRRRLELQKKHAARGLDTLADVLIEIEDVTQQIRAYEEEIATLEARAVAGHTPIAEVEYQAMLAEEWDKSSGRLKLAQRTRLDWARVRLGIALEQAQAMEYAVRVQLAEELFDDLNLNYLPHQYENVPQPRLPFDFDRLRKAIQLDLPTATRLFHTRLALVQHFDLRTVENKLLDPHSACRQDDLGQYSRFLGQVKAALAQAGGVNR
jgi:hypothetical protein